MNALRRHLPTASRLLLGVIFLVNGLNGFFNFLPMPTPPPAAAAFAGALFQTGYFFPMLKVIEVLAGSMLLAGVLVPLTLTVLAPIVVNIVAFHLFLAPGGSAVALVVLALELHLAWAYRAVFAPLFVVKAQPARAAQPGTVVQAPPRAAAA